MPIETSTYESALRQIGQPAPGLTERIKEKNVEGGAQPDDNSARERAAKEREHMRRAAEIAQRNDQAAAEATLAASLAYGGVRGQSARTPATVQAAGADSAEAIGSQPVVSLNGVSGGSTPIDSTPPRNTFPSVETIVKMDAKAVAKVFDRIISELKGDGSFSFSKFTPENFTALKAVYTNGKLSNDRSLSGSEYAHAFANSILRSSELGTTVANKSIMNDFEAQGDFAKLIKTAGNPEDFKRKMEVRFAPQKRV